MTERVTSIAPDARLEDIAHLLVAEQIGGVPVTDFRDMVVGFVSETDVVAALLESKPRRLKAADIMSTPAITIDEFAPSEEVMEKLRETKIHHLPVVRSGRLVGIISPIDVLRYFVEEIVPPPQEVG